MNSTWIKKVYSIWVVTMLILFPITSIFQMDWGKSAAGENPLKKMSTITGSSDGDNFGWRVSWAGDLNGDGFDDVIVGAPYTNISGDWWNASWAYRKKLTFDNSGQIEDLVNFPVLVNLSSSNFQYTNARADGLDLRFIDADGITELKYHIENWDPLGYSYVWVNVTEIAGDSSDDFIWMYYGNLGASDAQDVNGTYDSNYSMVQHLEESPNDDVEGHNDSTSNDNDGTPKNFQDGGGGTTDAAGKIYGADEFGGDDDYVDCGNDTSLNIGNATGFSINAWIYPKELDNSQWWDNILFSKLQDEDNNFYFRLRDEDQMQFWSEVGGTSYTAWGILDSGYDFTKGSWYMISWVIDRTVGANGALKVYHNGDLAGTFSFESDISGVDISNIGDGWIGAYNDYGTPGWLFNGTIDEVRISNIARSADWIRAQYLSMNNSFVTYGNEEMEKIEAGAAYIFFGYPGMGLNDLNASNANVTIYGERAKDHLGWSIGDAGNVNDDGYDDIIIGAPEHDSHNFYWGPSDKKINQNSDSAIQIYPDAAVDSNGNIIVAWRDTRSGSLIDDIYAQKFDSDGNPLWNSSDVRVNQNITDAQYNPAVDVDSDGNAIVVWHDKRYGYYEIFAQKLNSTGDPQWGPNDVKVSQNSSAYLRDYCDVVVDLDGNAIIVWRDTRNGDSDIYAQKLDPNGVALWGPEDVKVNKNSDTKTQTRPAVNADFSGNTIFVWEDYRSGYTDIYAQKLNLTGDAQLGFSDKKVNRYSGNTYHEEPDVAIDPDGNAIVVWMDERNGISNHEIYAQKLNITGDPQWGPQDEKVNQNIDSAQQYYPAVDVDPYKNAIVVWMDLRNGDNNMDIYSQKLNSSGNAQWGTQDLKVNQNPDKAIQSQTAVTIDNNGNTFVVWTDERNGSFNRDIYAQKFSVAQDGGGAYIFYGKGSWNDSYDASSADVKITGENEGDKLGCSVSGCGNVNSDNYYTNWLYRKKITINASQILDNLTDFPILINITDSDLQSKARSDGYDILFTADDGATKLDHEMERFESGSGALMAWVRIPKLSCTTNTIIYMYYGNSGQTTSMENPSGVWDSDYSAVWHLSDDFLDSTGNDRGGINNGSEDIEGLMADGQDFERDDNTDRIEVGNWNVPGQEITLQAWVKFESFDTNDGRIISKAMDEGEQDHVWMLSTKWNVSGYKLRFRLKTGADDGSGTTTFMETNSSLDTDKWMFVVATYDGSEMRLRLDQTEMGNVTKTGNIRENDWDIWLGNNPGSVIQQLDGILDEVRISSIRRSDAWLDTEYNNMNNTSSFHTVGTEEINPISWMYKKSITINASQVMADLVDFPLLINTLDSDLKDKARSDGYDIVFTSSDGLTKLDHEIEYYNSMTSEIIAWVRIPFLSSISDTTIYMYYGNDDSSDKQNPEGVWKDNYTAVWHLSETGEGSVDEYKESTSHYYHGRGGGGTGSKVPSKVSSKIGNGQLFDGNDDHINISKLNPQSYYDFTVSAWFKSSGTTVGEDGYILWHLMDDRIGPGFGFGTTEDPGYEDRLRFMIFENGAIGTEYFSLTDIVDQKYHYVVGVRANGRVKIYIDGIEETDLVDQQAGTTLNVDSNMGSFIGDLPGYTEQLDGILDEVRISRVGRSIEWIETEFANQNDTGSFYTMSEEESYDNFDDIIIGAYGYNNDQGRAYIFSGGSWFNGTFSANSANVTISGNALGDRFGWDVSGVGDTNKDGFSEVIIGAPGNNSDTGAVYIFLGDISMPTSMDAYDASMMVFGDSGGDEFGYSVARGKDLNNDGYDDIVVGAPGYNSNQGRVYIFYGESYSVGKNDILTADKNPDTVTIYNGTRNNNWEPQGALGVGNSPYSVFVADANNDGFNDIVSADNTGNTVTIYNGTSGGGWEPKCTLGVGSDPWSVFVGDANNDGYNDILTADTTGDSITVYNGTDNGWDPKLTLSVDGSSFSVFVGDANNDGYNDILTSGSSLVTIYNGTGSGGWEPKSNLTVGSSPWSLFVGDANNDGYNDILTANTGDDSVTIYNGTSGGEWEPKSTLSVGNAPNCVFVGDANNDGYNDILTADVFDDTVTLYKGMSSGGWEPKIALSTGIWPYSVFVGDANNDGYNDIVTADNTANTVTIYNGSGSGDWEPKGTLDVGKGPMSVFVGNANNDRMGVNIDVSNADVILTGESIGDSFGFSISTVGDINGDEVPDLIVGAPYYNNGAALDAGALYVFEGGASMDNIFDWIYKGENAEDQFGWSVSYAGNVNGDGWAYIIVGAPNNDDKGVNSGKAYLLITSSKPVITDVMATPNIQNIDGFINITCDVIATSGVNSVWLNITLPAGGYTNTSMTQGTGNQWYHDDNYATLGTHQFTIWAEDSTGNWTKSDIFQFEVVNRPPLLTSGKVYPIAGISGSWFNFTVTYRDLDNHPSDSITLNLTGPSGGIYDLNEVDPSDSDYTDGKEYYYNITLIEGTYSFHFAANDSEGDWVETSEIDFPSVGASNPILTEQEVWPISGYVDTRFNFTVNYSHPLNISAENITLNLSGPSGGVFYLIEVDPLDTNYTDGKMYYYNLSGLDVGNYFFHFAANDTNGNWSESGSLSFDVLDTTSMLSQEEVDPNTGFTDTWFNFTVNYTDLDNNAPNTITVNITGVGVYDLDEVDISDTDYTDGKQYYCNLSGFTVGQYSFHFAANDTVGNWTESLSLVFDVLNRNPFLAQDDINPTLGFTDTWFNFTVNYTDLDNHAPNTITVNITGLGVYDLMESDSLDTDYTDSKEYYLDMSGFGVGQYSFHFAANDTEGSWIESHPLVFEVLNRNPLLTQDKVDPSTGYIDTWFNFTVTYSDLDNHDPNTITVNITGVGIYDLMEVDSLDTDYTDGKDYYYNISGLGVGQHTFHFAANDTVRSWIESLPSVFEVLNRVPTLTLDDVDPITGYIDTWFNFSVVYTDLDNQEPDTITVNITGMGIYDLIEVDSLDIDYSDGKEYYFNISGFGMGQYTFHFAANDTEGNWTENAPLIFDVLNRNPLLTQDMVDPIPGYIDTWFNFSVIYTDLDNHKPDTITVNITGVGVYDLTETDSLDTDYTDGKEYYYNLSGFAIGQYTFHFAANDTQGNWIESPPLVFDVINRIPILVQDEVDPDTGYTDTWYNFTVNYTDLDNHDQDTITVNITGMGVYDLFEADSLDSDYTDGKEYYYNLTGFGIGQYAFHFAANDTLGDWVESLPAVFEVLNRIPLLSLDEVNPTSGFTDTWYNFTVTYTDLDDHEPETITVNITGIGVFYLMEVDSLDIDYIDGKEYYYNISGFGVGQYAFHFAANDTEGAWTESLPSIFDVVNRAPWLSQDNVDPNMGHFDTWFNFTVNYSDLDNHAPDIITVNISGVGVFDLIEVNSLDSDYTDGKLYYYNISGFDLGQYTFHFASNDSIGLWGLETPGIDSINITTKHGVLDAIDCSVEFSEAIQLNATLFDDDSNPIPNQNITFYIDLNKNGTYDEWEVVGYGTTLSDGTISIIYYELLSSGTFDFIAKYNGSELYYIENNEALLTIDPKQAYLIGISDVVEQGENTYLTALLMDDDDDPIAGERVDFYLDKDDDGIYYPSEFIGSSITLTNGVASIFYNVDLTPQDYGFWVNYVGSQNYNVSEIEGTLTVQNTSNDPPTILWTVPDQLKSEDSPPWTLNLTNFGTDDQDSGQDLDWFLTGVNTSLYSVTGMNSSDDVFTFIPVPDAFGDDETTLWLVDSSNAMVSQVLWINITPVNDFPSFDPPPPNIYVHYDDPDSEDDDPAPWDYTFYVHDIETPIEELVITTSEPTVDSGEGYVEVDGLNVTFHYPQDMVGKSIFVILTLFDGTDRARTMIVVNVTSDWVPEKVKDLPDVVIEENTTVYDVFDLDDYFTDKDHDILFYTSGHFHVEINISENHTVDMTALGHWTGSEYVTFRAKDPVGAFSEDTIKVTVIPVNDIPIISGVPNLVVHFNYSYKFDLSPYIFDPDNLTSDLMLFTSESTDYITIQENNNLGIVVKYPMSMNGMSIPVTISVSDGMGSSSQQIYINVTSDFPPELIKKLPDVFFDEDTVLLNAFQLDQYFKDEDKDNLYYTNRTRFINVTINDDLTVDFFAPENWYGSEIVIFRATDPTGAIAEDQILVVVVPINDPPVIKNIPKQEKKAGEQWILDLSQYIVDIDNDASELMIIMNNNVGQGYVSLVGNILIFQYPEDIDEDVITITVSDGKDQVSRSFIVSLKRSIPVTPTIWDLIPWPWVFFTLLLALGGAIAIYRKKSHYIAYEAFLIHEKGLPIAHAARKESSELEDVVVSGMFTAVQDFINDAFAGKSSDEDWELDEMKFGENKILIERSQNLYLAIIFEGNGEKLRNRVRKLLKEINKKYGTVLEDWDGDMSKLRGLRPMVVELIAKRGDKQQKKQKTAQPKKEAQWREFEDALMGWEDTGDRGVQDLDKFLESVEEALMDHEAGEPLLTECPVCGKEFRTEDSKCPRCGIEFEKLKEKLQDVQQAEIMGCPSCGTKVGKDESKCNICGMEFLGLDELDMIFQCPVCGANVEANATYCFNCSAEFEN